MRTMTCKLRRLGLGLATLGVVALGAACNRTDPAAEHQADNIEHQGTQQADQLRAQADQLQHTASQEADQIRAQASHHADELRSQADMRADQLRAQADQARHGASQQADQIRGDGRHAADTTPTGVETTPTAHSRFGAARGGGPVALPTAWEQYAEARCDREARCNNVGSGRRYGDRATCLTAARQDRHDAWGANACRAGVNAEHLSACLSDVRTQECSNPIQDLARVAACRTGEICDGR